MARQQSAITAVLAVLASSVRAATLDDVCTPTYVAAHLPADGYFGDYALALNADSVTANPVINHTVGPVDSVFFPAAQFDYCNVSFTYSHEGRDDSVLLTLWLPTPDNFQNRFLTTGGGGYAINSQLQSLPGGVMYGAVAGQTDGGFGTYQTNAISTFLVENGTIDWQNVYMFGYQAIRELSLVGREFTDNFYNLSGTRLYTYYQVRPSRLPSWSLPETLTEYPRDVQRVAVKAGAKVSASRMPTMAQPLVLPPSALPSNRSSISIPTSSSRHWVTTLPRVSSRRL